jgi:hypothetical protein
MFACVDYAKENDHFLAVVQNLADSGAQPVSFAVFALDMLAKEFGQGRLLLSYQQVIERGSASFIGARARFGKGWSCRPRG